MCQNVSGTKKQFMIKLNEQLVNKMYSNEANTGNMGRYTFWLHCITSSSCRNEPFYSKGLRIQMVHTRKVGSIGNWAHKEGEIPHLYFPLVTEASEIRFWKRKENINEVEIQKRWNDKLEFWTCLTGTFA